MSHTLLRDLHQAAANLEAAVVTQHVWGVRPGHRDELILRDRATGAGTSSGSDEPLDERLWCLMDYYDPTAIVNTEGAVVERYRFSAFGLRAILDADFDPRAESDYAWDFAFKGQFLDLESGYYNYGYRYYSPELGGWLSRDPIGERGGVNLYVIALNNIISSIDYLGLSSACEHNIPQGWDQFEDEGKDCECCNGQTQGQITASRDDYVSRFLIAMKLKLDKSGRYKEVRIVWWTCVRQLGNHAGHIPSCDNSTVCSIGGVFSFGDLLNSGPHITFARLAYLSCNCSAKKWEKIGPSHYPRHYTWNNGEWEFN